MCSARVLVPAVKSVDGVVKGKETETAIYQLKPKAPRLGLHAITIIA